MWVCECVSVWVWVSMYTCEVQNGAGIPSWCATELNIQTVRPNILLLSYKSFLDSVSRRVGFGRCLSKIVIGFYPKRRWSLGGRPKGDSPKWKFEIKHRIMNIWRLWYVEKEQTKQIVLDTLGSDSWSWRPSRNTNNVQHVLGTRLYHFHNK